MLLSKKGYSQGVFFTILTMLISCANDVISKFMGQRLDSSEILFFRFFFAFISLIPFVFIRGKAIFSTSKCFLNIFRGITGAVSFYLYTYSVIKLPIVDVVTILWTIPLFVMVFSAIILREKISLNRWIATFCGFFGLAIITFWNETSAVTAKFSIHILYIVPIISAVLFALQDIAIKFMVEKESKLTMLFYFSIVTTIVSFFPACMVWKTPTLFEIAMLFMLGIFGNLIQVFIFKAFYAADLSALAPYRYLEFIFSAIAGYLFFYDIPRENTVVGAVILIPCTLYLAYFESRKKPTNEQTLSWCDEKVKKKNCL